MGKLFDFITRICVVGVLFVILSSVYGCGGASLEEISDSLNELADTEGVGDAEGVTQGGSQQACTTSLQEHLENINDFSNPVIPSWDEIDCFTGDLVRLENPNFYKMAHSGDTVPGTPQSQPAPTVLQWIDHWDTIYTNYGSNISPALMSPVPPWVQENGEEFDYPLTPSLLDQKLRAAAIVFINEKLKGRRIRVVQFYPPSDQYDEDDFYDEASFREFVTNVWVPEKITEAQMAERIKAEYYIPFPLEVEVFIKNLPFIDDLSESEAIQLAQDFIDEIHAAVAPHFNGTLSITSVSRYDSMDDPWNAIEMSAFDQIAFGLFPECNMSITQSYLDRQIANYEIIIARDQVPWVFSEVFINPDLYNMEACIDNFASIEADLVNAVIDTMEDTVTPPVGAGFDQYLFVTDDAADVVIDYFDSK